jgi:hypothetical protein
MEKQNIITTKIAKEIIRSIFRLSFILRSLSRAIAGILRLGINFTDPSFYRSRIQPVSAPFEKSLRGSVIQTLLLPFVNMPWMFGNLGVAFCLTP